jgi:hypothetical protein
MSGKFKVESLKWKEGILCEFQINPFLVPFFIFTHPLLLVESGK